MIQHYSNVYYLLVIKHIIGILFMVFFMERMVNNEPFCESDICSMHYLRPS